MTADTTKADQVTNLLDVTMSRLGRVDILVNNAAVVGGLLQGALEESSEELLSEDLDTKVVGYFRTAQAVAPHMKKQGWGRIVNIGGMSGRYAGVISGVRNAAVAHLTKTLSGQLAPYGITVNTIHPGTVRTERTDSDYETEAAAKGIPKAEVEQRAADAQAIGRIVDASEIGHLVCFLASPKSSGDHRRGHRHRWGARLCGVLLTPVRALAIGASGKKGFPSSRTAVPSRLRT